MKKLFISLFITSYTFAQINTEVHLFDIKSENDKWIVSNGKNISNNKGYDSQPHFYDENTILFSSNRNGQTDILKYDINSGKKDFISNTPNGSEYSPQRIPNSKNISAVRLDKDGLQRFYQYDFKTGTSKKLIKDFVVAYPMWYNQNTIISSVIVNDSLQLFISDLKKKKNVHITNQTGRSFHKIPNSNLVSFMKKRGTQWEIWSLNPLTKETKKLARTGTSEDVCWLPNGTILAAFKNMILKFNPKTDKQWSIFHRFKNENINNISRIMVNKQGNKLALVAEISPKVLAQEQLDGYNKRDIDAFLKPYAKNVKVYTYPNKLDYEGIEEMRKRYAPMFEKTKDLHCKILNRVVKGNVVIDEELVTANGNEFKAVAIYEITNGKISAVRFVR
ncbi:MULTISPECIES: nuclear transport factor 2 family protein [unclassified Tenacibaculum]|uniref:nuclear transport factor 2 family protein n=1 Tax=unclassified Tenacibaculum TaxID=2635139 RepID=UPI001F1B5C7F|nr:MULTISPECIES: nuclear transport factor 2 family protein [unclassified Tenacibaculum]MCF2874187.1 nuclear transport factor 2 family protein [Tenacibaculum sp. Cn5-1]MCF2934768.1 nuclear transport factor 2 family protein [Tenacibaculum sp. Cn5-34]MCG7510978.1 nuclear transport factor 2 family protein [Tenacibaculum sp. Cn5-46]